MNVLLKLMIALVVSAGLSYFLLKSLRTDVSDRLSENARRRIEEKHRLRAALAGDDEGGGDPAGAQAPADEAPGTVPGGEAPGGEAPGGEAPGGDAPGGEAPRER
jgi:hypothetical protein